MRCNRESSTCTRAFEVVFDLSADEFPINVLETLEVLKNSRSLYKKFEQDPVRGSSASKTPANA